MSLARTRTRSLSRAVTLFVSAFAFAALAAGCASFSIRTPAGFGQLRNQQPRYDYRAVSAYGVALGVRIVPNTERGNLDFWAEVVDRHLQHGGSYRPAGTAEVRTASGLTGRRMAYTFGDPQTGQTYWVAVFVTENKVFLVEAAGGIDAFTRARAGIESAMQSFRPT